MIIAYCLWYKTGSQYNGLSRGSDVEKRSALSVTRVT